MPEYVEAYFLDAAERVRLRVEPRADTFCGSSASSPFAATT